MNRREGETMSQYILSFNGKGVKPRKDMERIRSMSQTKILDESAQAVLVEAPERELTELVESLPRWQVSPLRMISLPNTRRRPVAVE
jgi:hypothetical protein